jgi:voltage-gated potassium channel
MKLDDAEVPYTVIDVHPDRVKKRPGSVLGRGTEAQTLQQAGVEGAVGIVAGTGDDMDNLSIIMTALELNPDLFVVARQENPHNDELFETSKADLVARRSLIVARRILAFATTPLLAVFNDHLVSQEESFARTVERRLEGVLNDRSPSLWTVGLNGVWAESIRAGKREAAPIRLDHITQNVRTPTAENLPCVCLLLERGASRRFLPGPNQKLKEGDSLLFAGRDGARREMLFALREPTALVSIATGRHQPRGSIMRRIARKRAS